MSLDITASGSTTLFQNDRIALPKAEAIKRSTVQKTMPKQEELSEQIIKADDVEAIVESMNEFIDPLRTNLKFVFHEELNEYYVTVVDPFTSEVIKEIPPKKMLDMYAAMTNYMGMLIDERI